jgi:hypothetical protein
MAHACQPAVHALHRSWLTAAPPSKRTCSFSVACTAPRVARSLKALDRRGRLTAVPSSGPLGFLPGVGVLTPGVRVRLLWSASTVCSLEHTAGNVKEVLLSNFALFYMHSSTWVGVQASDAAASADAWMPTWDLCWAAKHT